MTRPPIRLELKRIRALWPVMTWRDKVYIIGTTVLMAVFGALAGRRIEP